MITTLLIIIACIVSFYAGFKTGFNECDHKYKDAILEEIERVRKEMQSLSQTGQLFEKENQ